MLEAAGYAIILFILVTGGVTSALVPLFNALSGA